MKNSAVFAGVKQRSRVLFEDHASKLLRGLQANRLLQHFMTFAAQVDLEKRFTIDRVVSQFDALVV